MGKMFNLASLALLVVCIVWAWITVRKYSERKRLEEERAAALVAETASALRKARAPTAKS